MKPKVAIVFSTYNNAECIEECLKSCLNQSYSNVDIIIADDGSTDETASLIHKVALHGKHHVRVLNLPHGERGIARVTAVEEAQREGADYILIIDSDMLLESDMIDQLMAVVEKYTEIGALVIPEKAFTAHQNFFSKVKVFERNIINNAGEEVGKRSIEAARFWRMSDYLSTGGFNAGQISFEEIQPTLRYIERGGRIKRAVCTNLYHDEKKVLLRELLAKKAYYFTAMDRTLASESEGLRKALERWYFFRPVLYRKDNMKQYVRHPLLTAGMLFMYGCLSLLGVYGIIKGRIGRQTPLVQTEKIK
ncbi:glycosyltransferase family 2 protein [Paenibacillus xylanilyticus]|uniref:glycosyltransferase family 2 protein n=1 Tax=Paenibacillus xylanilyticus TaxID=248903 RepID=UPI00129DB0BB|nr:glycosyltransferase family A protein [Paenibacillus xylanilyticus]